MDNLLAGDGQATYSYDAGGSLSAIGTPSGSALAYTDRHGDLVGQFGAASTALTGSTTFDPWGTVKATTGMKGSIGYQSGWTEPTTKQVNMLTRWYDPDMGRFTSKDNLWLDPVPDSTVANDYAYVGDDPLDGTDPTGECWPKSLCNKVKAVANKVIAPIKKVAAPVVKVVQKKATSVKTAAKKAVNTVKHKAAKAVKSVVRQ